MTPEQSVEYGLIDTVIEPRKDLAPKDAA